MPVKEDSKKEYIPEKALPFISECYFLTQQALYVGYSITHKMVKLNNNVNRLDKLYNDMKDIYPKKFTDMIKQQLNTGKSPSKCIVSKVAFSVKLTFFHHFMQQIFSDIETWSHICTDLHL